MAVKVSRQLNADGNIHNTIHFKSTQINNDVVFHRETQDTKK